MGFERERVVWIGVDGVIDHILPVGTELEIVGRFELAVFHVVFLHPHKGSVMICFGIAVTPAENFLLLGVFLQLGRPVLFGVVELLLYLLINCFSLQCIVDLFNGLGHFLRGGIDKVGLPAVQLGRCYRSGIVPEFFELGTDPFFALLDRLAPAEGVAVGIGFDLGPVGVHVFDVQKAFFM